MAIHRLLVPVDFSEASRGALRAAIALAGQVGGELVVLHTWELSAFASPKAPLAVGTQHELEGELARFVASVDAGSVPIRSEVVLGPTAPTIVAAAARLSADVIVIGTTGRTGLPHVLLGSVAESVVRTARCPVLTIRG